MVWQEDGTEAELFFRLSLDMLCVLGFDGFYKKLNPAWEKTLGYAIDELKERPYVDFVHPGDRVMTIAEVQKLTTRDQMISFTNRYMCRDGTHKWLQWNAMSLSKRQLIYAIVRDVTEHRYVAGELSRSEEKLYDIIQRSPIPAFMIGRDHRVTHWNRALEALSSIKAEEVIGTRDQWRAFYSTERPCMADLLVDESFKSLPQWYSEKWKKSDLLQEAYEGTEFFPTLGEAGKWLHYTAAVIRNSVGELTGAIETLEDVTQREKVEEELRNSREELRNLYSRVQSLREEERTQVAREIHDELGQQLSMLHIDLTWLEDQLPKNKKAMLERVRSMEELVDQTVQSVRRIATKLRPALLDDFGLSAAVEWQAEEFHTRTGIECKVIINKEEILTDRDQSTAIFRIFQEALTNVSRHAHATKVEVRLLEDDQNLILEVKDNGRGINESQVVSSKSLGLIGMRERVYPWGGRVDISGIAGQGTAIIVTLPREKKG
jgi:PAS domain S-box-containing protein